MVRKRGNKANPTEASGSEATPQQQASNPPPRRAEDQPTTSQGGSGPGRGQRPDRPIDQPTTGPPQGQRHEPPRRDDRSGPQHQVIGPPQAQSFHRRDDFGQRSDQQGGGQRFDQRGGGRGQRFDQRGRGRGQRDQPRGTDWSATAQDLGQSLPQAQREANPPGQRQYDQRSGQRGGKPGAGYGSRDSSQAQTAPATGPWQRSEPAPPQAGWGPSLQPTTPVETAPKAPWGKAPDKPQQSVSESSTDTSVAAPSSAPTGKKKGKKGGKKEQETVQPSKDAGTTKQPPADTPKPQPVGAAGPSETPAREATPSVPQSQDFKKADHKPVFDIPARKGGKQIVHTNQFVMNPQGFPLQVNYLQIKFNKSNLKIYRYEVEFEEIKDESKKPKKPKKPAAGQQEPDRQPRLPKGLLRPAMNEFLRRHASKRSPAFDGRRSLFAAGTPLPFGDSKSDTVEVVDAERGGSTRQFAVTVRLIDQDLNLTRLNEYIVNGRTAYPPQDVIQALDIAIRQAPINTNRFLQVGQSFFLPPTSQPLDLGEGFELMHGFHQSGVLAWKPYLNVDVSNKAFPKPQPVIDLYMNDFQGNAQKFRRFIRGLKVDYMMPAGNQGAAPAKRTYTIREIGEPAGRALFEFNGKKVSVAQYFQQEKHVALRHPDTPTLITPNQSQLPMEFCRVSAKQTIMRKLTETQTSNMVRNTALGTEIRKDRIFSQIRHANFNADPCLQEFNVMIGGDFETVNAVVLKPPTIQYDQGIAKVDRGQWRQNNAFLNSCNLDKWVIINTHYKTSDEQIQNLIRQFQRVGRNMNMRIAEPSYSKLNARGAVNDRDFVEQFRKYPNAQIYVVVMDDWAIPECYSKIKRAAELESGVVTQCLKSNTVQRKGNDLTTISNILLKINAKLGGLNHELLNSIKPYMIKDSMIVGADVTHPSPGSNTFSIAAVAASYDDSAFKYRMRYKLQPPKVEMIESFSSLLRDHLQYYRKKNGKWPSRILYFRDGVSEGQFQQVLDIELRALRDACMKMGPDCRPKTTFLVVQKRHHTRFFPSQQFGDRSRNNNVVPGTLVDTQITHPTEFNFYLVSHQGIQGTSKPTKYHLLWDDSSFGVEELEQLTFYLCHMFARCNRSVSYPAPTYYAHLAAFRARAYWTENFTGQIDERRIESAAELERLQDQKGSIQNRILENNPMFFV